MGNHLAQPSRPSEVVIGLAVYIQSLPDASVGIAARRFFHSKPVAF